MPTTHFAEERDRWWREHAEELRSLTPAAFAAKYEIKPETVYKARIRYVPDATKKTITPRWWDAPEARAVLLLRIPVAEMAERLGVTEKQVCVGRSNLRKAGHKFRDLPRGKGPKPGPLLVDVLLDDESPDE